MKLLTLTILLSLFSLNVVAKEVKIDVDLDQLKTNVNNSLHNYNEYKKNLEISENNKKQTSKAIESLKKQKQDLSKSSQNVDKNKQAIEKMRLQIVDYKKNEQEKLTGDLAEINKLKDVLFQLENNKKKREINIAAYDKKLAEIEKEKQEWADQVKNLGELYKTIDQKITQIEKEKTDWDKKGQSYQKQADKWKNEHKTAEALYDRYDNLK